MKPRLNGKFLIDTSRAMLTDEKDYRWISNTRPMKEERINE